MDMIDEPIFITGCARSGTSLTAGIINICGGWGGELCGHTPYNPKGQFENLPIVKGMVKPFLRAHGWDPLGQGPLPDPDKVDKIATKEFCTRWHARIVNEIVRQGYPTPEKTLGTSGSLKPWFYKGAKLCLIWQVWARAFPKAKWLLVYRKDDLTVDSCMRTPFMRKYKTRDGWQKWVNFHWAQFGAMVEAGLNVNFLNSGNLIERDYVSMKIAIETLGLTWKQEKIDEFIEPRIWNTQK